MIRGRLETSRFLTNPQREAVGEVLGGVIGEDLWMLFLETREFHKYLKLEQKAEIIKIMKSDQLTTRMSNLSFVNKLGKLLGY